MHTRSRCSRRVPLASAGRASRACAATRRARRGRPRCSGPARTARAGWSCSCRRSCCSWARAPLPPCRAARCRRRSTAPRRWRRRTSSPSASPTARRAARATSPRPTGSPSACAPRAPNVTLQRFRAPDANGRTVPMTNVLGVVSGKGRSRDALVFIAGRDDPAARPGRERQRLRHGRADRARAHARRQRHADLARVRLGRRHDGRVGRCPRARPASARRPRAARGHRAARNRPRGRGDRAAALRRGAPAARRGLAAHGRAGAARRGRRQRAPAVARSAGRRARRAGGARRPGRRWSAAAPPSSASTARGPARARRSIRPSCSRPTSSGASAPPSSWPRSRSTRVRGLPASARPTSSRATAYCAAGRSSSSSWHC